MSDVLISILLPVHNGALYLEKAIDSLLAQTYTHFELLIINDGSTDDTEKIVQGYNDTRISYIHNKKNIGLIASLNNGIRLATGKYIARMDADDICHPDRLQIQKDFLDSNPDVAIVASTTEWINEFGDKKGIWEVDHKTITPEAIKKTMASKNCISHPTVMGRIEIFQQFLYEPAQKNIEDYYLWLCVLNAGYQIAKIPTALLYYRQHDQSVTNSAIKGRLFALQFRMKLFLVWNEWKNGRFTMYTISVFFAALRDGLTALAKKYKSQP
jgi:glycosyltransferase involved in cell wall biosynthesis